MSALPTFQTAGTKVTGIGNVSPAWPGSHAVDDIGLLFIESCGGEAANLSVAAGFTAVTNSPSSTGTTTNGTRLTVYWARATSTSMSSPTVTDPGNHVVAVICNFRGCENVGNPWNITAAAQKASASTSASSPTVTTTVDNCLIVCGIARDNAATTAQFSAVANASLGSVTERFDDGSSADGNGGGIGIFTGTLATQGATGTTTATVTSSINASLTIALMPIQKFAFVQQAIGSGSGTSFTVTLGAAPLAGSFLVLVGVDEVNGGVSISGGGATWTQCSFQGANFGLTIWLGVGCTGAGGLTTITYTMNSSATVRNANVIEFSVRSGLSGQLDQHPAGSSATSSTPTPATVTPAAADAVIIDAVDWASTNTIGAAGSSFTNMTQSTSATNRHGQGAYRIVGNSGTYGTVWTLSGSTAHDVLGISIIEGVAAGSDAYPIIGAGYYPAAA